MLTVFVEHFLTAAGREYFPNWVEEVRAAVVPFCGYRSLRIVTDVEQPERCLLFLEFAAVAELRVWGSSEAHRRVLEKIRPYQVRKQQSQLLLS